MSQLVKTKRQANFKDFKRFGALRDSSNRKTLYSTRSCVNWAFFWHSLNNLLFSNGNSTVISFKNLKILDLGNTLVVEIQKGILLYSCHIVRKFLNIDTEHNKTQQSQNVEARRR
jgi:hypothetical protein